MRLNTLTLLISVLIFSCTEESELTNTLSCHSTITYEGVDECYMKPLFKTEKGETISPLNLNIFIGINELVAEAEYIVGWNPVDKEIPGIGICDESNLVQAVDLVCFNGGVK